MSYKEYLTKYHMDLLTEHFMNEKDIDLHTENDYEWMYQELKHYKYL